MERHGHVCILLHFTKFCMRRQTRYQIYERWFHVPESMWAEEEATIEKEENHDGVHCPLCGDRPGGASDCGIFHLNIYAFCMPPHSCILQG